jgi:hypothetical protein
MSFRPRLGWNHKAILHRDSPNGPLQFTWHMKFFVLGSWLDDELKCRAKSIPIFDSFLQSICFSTDNFHIQRWTRAFSNWPTDWMVIRTISTVRNRLSCSLQVLRFGTSDFRLSSILTRQVCWWSDINYWNGWFWVTKRYSVVCSLWVSVNHPFPLLSVSRFDNK